MLTRIRNGLTAKHEVVEVPESKIKVAILPTDEEVMIARDCVKRIKNEL